MNGYLDQIINFFKVNNIKFGIGGIGSYDTKPISPKYIFASNIIYESDFIILSRSFKENLDFSSFEKLNQTFRYEYDRLDSLYNHLRSLSEFELNNIKQEFKMIIQRILPQEKSKKIIF